MKSKDNFMARNFVCFSADDWQCSKCGNVNWARRQQCNMCNAPKFGEIEERTGYGGGYNDRGVVEYKERRDDDDEYDEFGRRRKKRKVENRSDDDSKDSRYSSPSRKKYKDEDDRDEPEDDEDQNVGNVNNVCIYFFNVYRFNLIKGLIECLLYVRTKKK